MTQTPPTSWFNRITVIASCVVTGSVIGIAYWQESGWRQLWPTLLIIAVVASWVWAWLQRRMLHRARRRLLAGRTSQDAVTFGTTYFSEIARGPEVAAAVRCRLEQHLDMDLPGLRPDDRFADLHADPELFFDEIAREFGFNPPQKSPEFSALVSSLPTVRDLVEFVVLQTNPDVKAECSAGHGCGGVAPSVS